MKTLPLSVAVLVLALRPLCAQETVQHFNQRLQLYEALAVKVYPDCAVADSPLVKLMAKMDAALNANHSRLFNFASKPIILAAEAADILKIKPQWEAVTGEERDIVYDAVTDGLISSLDMTIGPITAQTQSSAQRPFNPGSMNDDVTANSTTAPAPSGGTTDTNVVPGKKGYVYFYNLLKNQSGPYTDRNPSDRGFHHTYEKGPFAGMSEGEAQVYAQNQWGQLPRDQQVAYEQKGETYGSGPDPAKPVDGRYDVNITTNPDQ